MSQIIITGIYKITSPSNKIYIGQAKNIYLRWKHYKKLHCKIQPAIYRSLLKYGVDSHIFEIIEECEFENLNIRERYWQEYYNVLGPNGLNCVLQETNLLKRKTSQSTKNKLSLAGKGRIHTKETIDRISKVKKGIRFTEEHKSNLKKSHIGLKRTREQKINSIETNGKSKLVLNLETGIYYSSCRQASFTCKFDRSYLANMLNGRYVNKTSFIYV